MLLGHMLKWLVIKCIANFVRKKIKEGGAGIHRLKLHLAGVKGQITSCQAENIGEIRKQLKEQFEKYEQEKNRQK